MKWLFLLFFMFICLYLFVLSDHNFYQLIMIFGKKGSGKTTLIAKLSQKYIKQGYTVYSNVPIKGCLLYKPEDIGVYSFKPESVVFCDEVGLIWHNRDYKNFQKCVIEWFKLQRHYKIRMYLFSQAFDVDKVLRNLTDQLYILNRFGKISLIRPVSKNISVSTDSEGCGTIVDTYKMGSIFNWHFTYLPRWYGFFNSFEVKQLPMINATLIAYDELSKVYINNRVWLLYKLKCAVNKVKLKVIITIFKIIGMFKR